MLLTFAGHNINRFACILAYRLPAQDLGKSHQNRDWLKQTMQKSCPPARFACFNQYRFWWLFLGFRTLVAYSQGYHLPTSKNKQAALRWRSRLPLL